MDKVTNENFVLIDGKKPIIQHKTQFEKQDDVSQNFKWLNTTDYGKVIGEVGARQNVREMYSDSGDSSHIIFSNFQTSKQYHLTNNGKKLIIASSVACSFELDYRLLEISNETGMSLQIFNRFNIKVILRFPIIQLPSDAFGTV